MKIIPAIDVKDGRCVRLLKGDFDEVTDYSGDPASVAKRFYELGFDHLHIVDLDGARDGIPANVDIVKKIAAATPMSVQVGGGIRLLDTLTTWFDSGVSRCVIGSLAVTEPDLVESWFKRFTAEQIVLALDVKIDSAGTPLVATHGWRKTSDKSLWDCIDFYRQAGLRHILCTDVSRDGALSGPNVQLYAEIVQRYPELQLQASGGVRNINDIMDTTAAGASGTITGRALLDGLITREEIASFQQSA